MGPINRSGRGSTALEAANQFGKTRKAEQRIFLLQGSQIRCLFAGTTKKTVKTTFHTLVGPHFFMAFTVFCAHYAKDHLPKSNGREKAAKWTNVAAKQIT